MKYDPRGHGMPFPSRRSIRLKGYDYTQAGAYFITTVTQDRVRLFGEVVAGEMQLNDAGKMIWAEWEALPQRFPAMKLDAIVVMPNHVHGIIVIVGPEHVAADNVGAGLVPARVPRVPRATTQGATTRVAPTVGDVVGAFKSATTVSYTRGVKQSGWPSFRGRLWQRNYYEHIIRNDESLDRIREYVANNPLQWELDQENPNFVRARHAVSQPKDEPWRI
jgi:REP element-mobilizing transposase RayT